MANDKPELFKMSAEYTQKSDCCGDVYALGNSIEISTEDGGGGKYFVIKTERWAFDNIDELTELFKDFIGKVETELK